MVGLSNILIDRPDCQTRRDAVMAAEPATVFSFTFPIEPAKFFEANTKASRISAAGNPTLSAILFKISKLLGFLNPLSEPLSSLE